MTTDALGYVGLKFQDDRTSYYLLLCGTYRKGNCCLPVSNRQGAKCNDLIRRVAFTKELIKGVDQVVDNLRKGKQR